MQMIEGIAEIFGLPWRTVEALDRVLAEAGLRSRTAGGRAPNAVTGADIFLVAVAAQNGWSLKDTPEQVREVSSLAFVTAISEKLGTGPHGELMYLADHQPLVPSDLDRSSAIVAIRYPPKVVQIRPTLGATMGVVIERYGDESGPESASVDVKRKPLRAEVVFWASGKSERYTAAYGQPICDYDTRAPRSSFGFEGPVLAAMSQIYRM
jgi:hypothetical protein